VCVMITACRTSSSTKVAANAKHHIPQAIYHGLIPSLTDVFVRVSSKYIILQIIKLVTGSGVNITDIFRFDTGEFGNNIIIYTYYLRELWTVIAINHHYYKPN